MVKQFKPKTPSMRGMVLPSFDELTREKGKRATIKPHKPLLRSKMRISGRNNAGRICCFHRGGGAKRAYRFIDFKRNKDNIPAKVFSVEYDPNRSAFIALLHYADGEKRYILAPKGLVVGDEVSSGEEAPYKVGCCVPMQNMPLGSVIHNIELTPGRGGILVRSAGGEAQLVARSNGTVTLKMPSGEIRTVHEKCRATYGALSNHENNLRVDGKAGRTRWQGFRPTVRGTAMNPVDHPHGGGEGKHNGYHPRSPWGLPTKGYKTRKKSRRTDYIVKDRRSKK